VTHAADIVVSTQWLADNLHAPNQLIVDCSWYLPELERDADAEYRAQHLPGAVRFDIEDIADHGSPYAHMLPSAELFAAKAGWMGIGNGTRVVVYDTNYVSARAWWMLRVFGHDNVVVLDGGLSKWLAEGRPVESGEMRAAPRTFVARKRLEMVADWREVLGTSPAAERSSWTRAHRNAIQGRCRPAIPASPAGTCPTA
jgi:thiosulfate/3-mercaptopyruvate sulfurtransferase